MFASSPLSPLAAADCFGRVARSWPAPAAQFALAASPQAAGSSAVTSTATLPIGVRRITGSLHRHGGLATAAHLGATLLARAATFAQRCATRWSQRRQRLLTERALRELSPATLRDLGMHESELTSLASEVAGEVEATRTLAWRQVAHRAA